MMQTKKLLEDADKKYVELKQFYEISKKFRGNKFINKLKNKLKLVKYNKDFKNNVVSLINNAESVRNIKKYIKQSFKEMKNIQLKKDLEYIHQNFPKLTQLQLLKLIKQITISSDRDDDLSINLIKNVTEINNWHNQDSLIKKIHNIVHATIKPMPSAIRKDLKFYFS